MPDTLQKLDHLTIYLRGFDRRRAAAAAFTFGLLRGGKCRPVRMAEDFVVRDVWPTLACPSLRELYGRKIDGENKPSHQLPDPSIAKPLSRVGFHRLWSLEEVAPMADCWW